MRPHHNSILDKLLHAIDQPITIPRRQQPRLAISIPPLVLKSLVRHGQAALIRNHEHAHPTAQDAQRIHSVEALTAAIDLNDGQSAALGRAHRPGRQRDPVDLVLEDGGGAAVLLGTDPDVAVGPEREAAQLLHGGVGGGHGVADGQRGGVEEADVAAQAVQDARGLEGHEFGVGAAEAC